jgi:hypothetical protein
MLAGLVFGAGAGRSRALQISTADWSDPPTAAAAGAPRAARVDPLHATARHKTLHHFVAKVQWSGWQLFHCVSVVRRGIEGFRCWCFEDHR